MRPFRDLPIKRKLILINTLSCILALLLASAAFAIYESITFMHTMTRNLSTLAEVIGNNSAAALIFDDENAAAETLAALAAEGHILTACIYSSNGGEFARYLRPDASGDCPPVPVNHGYRFEEDRFVLFQTIVFDGEEIGTIYLQADLKELDTRLAGGAGILAIVLLASSLVAFLLSSKLQRAITEPIMHLVQTAKLVSDNKDYSVRAVTINQDESALLINTFNHMLSQIQEHDAALQKSEKHFRSLIENASDIITILSAAGTIRYGSPSIERVLGHKPEDLIGRNILEFVHRDDAPNVRVAFIEGKQNLGDAPLIEFRFRHKDGSWHYLEARTNNLHDDSEEARLVVNSRDISDRKVAEEQLVHDAFHDALTGLPNRALFMERLTHAAKRRKRGGENLFAVLFLDLDRFKIINDSLGHNIGDHLLIQVARRLEACMRPADTIARLGGDEFTILLEDIRDVGDATRVANRIHEKLMLPFKVGEHEVFTTTSIGIAQGSTGNDQPEDLLRDADIAMYRAKALRTVRYVKFNKAMHAQAMALLQLENDLRRALERQEFRIHYQPIVSLDTSRVVGFEALLRWERTDRGLILPADFIPVAEETGLIIPIGRWVLREACRQIRAWQVQFPTNPPLLVTVNLSSKQLSQSDLVELIDRILRETPLDARSLKLEITESVLMENIESAITILSKLRAMGVQSYMDDFGTGYSSLSYLQQLPVDVLKIDRSFVSGMGVHVKNLEVVRTIISLAHNLGMKVTAEGIETTEQLVQLRALECKYGQGYFFSKPLDSGAAGTLIAAQFNEDTSKASHSKRASLASLAR